MYGLDLYRSVLNGTFGPWIEFKFSCKVRWTFFEINIMNVNWKSIGILRVLSYFDKNTVFHCSIIISILYNKLPQLYSTLCDPVDCSPPGSSVHGDSAGKKNTGVGCHAFLQGIFQPRDWTQVSHIAGRFFTSWGTREAQEYWSGNLSLHQQIFPTQELNQGLLHCRRMLYQLSYQGNLEHFIIIIIFKKGKYSLIL